jgi:putative nucleotidyltransferase with HDIG domain
MFSSVLAGVRGLPGDLDAFFVLPADCALVRPEVLRRLMQVQAETLVESPTATGSSTADPRRAVLHPTCCGRRGHPPLLPGYLGKKLLGADSSGDLRSFLNRHAGMDVEVEVQDLTILMDMDTPKDYERLRRIAAILDAAEVGAPRPSALTGDDAMYLLRLLDLPDRVVTHSQAVARVAVTLAEAIAPQVDGLDIDLVRCGGLLHDMAKAARKHGLVGRILMENLGLQRLASVVGSHMVISPDQLDTPLPTEEQLVYLADKLVVDDRVSSLDERAASTLRKHAGDSEVARGVEARMGASLRIVQRMEALAGRRLHEILATIEPEGLPDA